MQVPSAIVSRYKTDRDTKYTPKPKPLPQHLPSFFKLWKCERTKLAMIPARCRVSSINRFYAKRMEMSVRENMRSVFNTELRRFVTCLVEYEVRLRNQLLGHGDNSIKQVCDQVILIIQRKVRFSNNSIGVLPTPSSTVAKVLGKLKFIWTAFKDRGRPYCENTDLGAFAHFSVLLHSRIREFSSALSPEARGLTHPLPRLWSIVPRKKFTDALLPLNQNILSSILHQRGSKKTESSWHRHFGCAIDYTYENREFTGHGFLYGESLYLLYRCQGRTGPMRDNTDCKSTAIRVYRFSHSSFLTCLQYRVRICADWANVYRYAENHPEYDDDVQDNDDGLYVVIHPDASEDEAPGPESGDEAPEPESGDETPESDSGDETPESDSGDETPESDSGDETYESDPGDETYQPQGGGSRKRPRVTRRRYAQQLANASVGRVSNESLFRSWPAGRWTPQILTVTRLNTLHP